MRLPNKLLLLAPAEPMELGGHEYGLCLVNALCPSHTGVLPFDVVEKAEGACPLEPDVGSPIVQDMSVGERVIKNIYIPRMELPQWAAHGPWYDRWHC